MRNLLLLIMTACTSIAGNATELLNGYIVMPGNDTIKCKIKSGKSENYHYGVTIVTEQGEEQSFGRRKKILGFGFTKRGIDYDFLYVDAKGDRGFYQAIVIGPRYKLYGITVVIQSTPGMPTTQPRYVLYNSAGEFAVIDTCVLCSWKKRIREILKDDVTSLDLLRNISRPKDIPEFILAINK